MRRLKRFLYLLLLADLLFELLCLQPKDFGLSRGRLGVMRHLQNFQPLVGFLVEDKLAEGVVLLEVMQCLTQIPLLLKDFREKQMAFE